MHGFRLARAKAWFCDLGRGCSGYPAECFDEAEVFESTHEAGHFFESEVVNGWLCVAAGIEGQRAQRYFAKNGAKQSRAETKIHVEGGGLLSFALKLRKFDPANMDYDIGNRITSFAPHRKVPSIELDDGFFRIQDLTPGDDHISHLRWDFDAGNAYQQPQEAWLRHWKDIVGFNPAHPVSHLHLNQTPLDHYQSNRDAQTHPSNDFRLATGVPNPLAWLMSIAAWLRQR